MKFYTKETRKKGDRKDKLLQILLQFAGTYPGEYSKFFEFEYFLFFFVLSKHFI